MKILVLSDFLPDSQCKFSDNFRSVFDSSDAIIFNLEGSPLLIDEQQNVPQQIMPFKVDILIEFLKRFDYTKFYLALANNHILDNGLEGFDYLVQKLEENGIKYFGTKSRPFINIGDIHVLNIVTAETVANRNLGEKRLNYLFYNSDNVNQQIQNLETLGDKLVFYPHWGRDMDRKVFKTFDKKIRFNKPWLILGHHTHVITGVDQNRIYSMGNTYIPHPYYFEKYPATRFGLAVILDSETMNYDLLMTSIHKNDSYYLIDADKFVSLPSSIVAHGKNYGKLKKLFLNTFAFKGNYFDKVKLSVLQMLSILFALKYKWTKK